MTEIVTRDGKTINRLSRWIKIRQAFDITKRHSLYRYAIDGNGHVEGQDCFDPATGTEVTYFIWNGRKWALDQFLRLSYPIFWEDEDGYLQFLSGYDGENWYNPILIEIHPDGEYVRVYEEGREDKCLA